MVDLPAGFRIVTQGGESAVPALPPGFRVVQPTASQAPSRDAQGREVIADTDERAGLAIPGTVSEFAAGKPDTPPAKPETYDESYLAQGMSGVNEGIATTLGIPVDTVAAVMNLGAKHLNSLVGTNIPQIESPAGGADTFRAMMGGAIKPQTDDPGKQAVRRVAQDIGAASVPVLGTASRAARPLVTAAKEMSMAVGSGAGAAAAQQVAPDNPWAELAGQLAGALTVGGATAAGRRAITPVRSSPERQAAADIMAREGVDLTAGQRTGAKGLQYAESELGGAAIADFTERQAEQFTHAALRRAGISGTRATPETMNDGFTTIGREFDRLAAQNALVPDRQFGADLNTTLMEYRSLVPDSQRAPVVNEVIRDIVDRVQNAPGQPIAGDAYQSLRSRLDKRARSVRASDPQLSEALSGIRMSLDDAMERSIAQNNPSDLGAWQQVRGDYRNMLVLEKAAQGSGENAAMGIISPAALRTAVQSVYGKRSYVRGQNDFAELAQAGQATMTPLPQSGTAPRTAVRNLTMGVPGVVGAGLGGSLANVPGAVAGAALGMALPKAAGAALLSPAGRNYLSNRVLAGPPTRAPGVGAGAAMLAGQNDNALRIRPNHLTEITVRGGAR